MTGPTSRHAGFTLVELLAGTTIFAIIMLLLLSVLNSFEATEDIKVTRQRMEKIAAKAKEYYLSRENLPLPWDQANGAYTNAAVVGEVPIAALHLQTKYRLDGWGNPFQYFNVRNDGTNGRPGRILIDPLSAAPPGGPPLPVAMVDIPQADLTVTPPTGKTLITGLLVNNAPVAGVLISSGPNGVFEYTQTPGSAGPPVTPESFTINPGSDDLILSIDLNTQATQIAQSELKKIGEKVRAFNDRYLGKDDDNDGAYDEDGCNPERYPGGTWTPVIHGTDTDALGNGGDPCSNCPPGRGVSDYLPIHINMAGNPSDYSCGLPTLDDMKANYWNVNVNYGYYYPQIDCYGFYFDISTTPHTRHPANGGQFCTTTPADYYRVPMNLGAPAVQDCHWGLVGDPTYVFATGQTNTELTNDQARAALFCAYGLSPADIVDPWLNGYTWGCGQGAGQGGSSCTNQYPDSDPHFHKFFSAGPDKTVNTADDIIAPL